MKKNKIYNLLAYCFLTLLIVAVFPFVVPKIIGYEPYGILSNSMEPEYPVGSVVYVKATDPKDVVKGDVITFKLGVAGGNVATHRVVSNDTVQQEFVTKGDHNDEIDATSVAYERVLGKVTICIPVLGSFYLWLVSSAGIAVCTFLLLMAIVLWIFVAKDKKKITKRQNEERIDE